MQLRLQFGFILAASLLELSQLLLGIFGPTEFPAVSGEAFIEHLELLRVMHGLALHSTEAEAETITDLTLQIKPGSDRPTDLPQGHTGQKQTSGLNPGVPDSKAHSLFTHSFTIYIFF